MHPKLPTAAVLLGGHFHRILHKEPCRYLVSLFLTCLMPYCATACYRSSTRLPIQAAELPRDTSYSANLLLCNLIALSLWQPLTDFSCSPRCLQAFNHSGDLYDVPAGCQTPLAQSVGPQHTIVTSQEEATSEEDVTDLLMLHIAQPAEAVFPDTNHTGCPMAGVNSRGVHDADQGLRLPPVTQQDADTHHSSSSTGSSTSAALYSWLNDLVALLWRSAAFHQSVLLVLLLSNPCNNALQLQVLYSAPFV